MSKALQADDKDDDDNNADNALAIPLVFSQNR